jgi:hypothetical protein
MTGQLCSTPANPNAVGWRLDRGLRYPSDLRYSGWALIAPMIPPGQARRDPHFDVVRPRRSSALLGAEPLSEATLSKN